ncbi:hypothetical protein CEUSTIGMA_g8598.t1 [Chlamydomonas eustigma]|uniref:Uncharacterized protein n=1 Tax=Chlamydomonas eustigma TaxID=1157962 RepID=A0A250XDK6_9CHLO|nr:hypothetical protein CEUSTIGMA_g8598.t1 [Chlamydomonas eustigma]|eukprot:GAX81165.1 hypothetical protein CEUSTIGMA_g8598.t1 [Chlamydomonas eustigma]
MAGVSRRSLRLLNVNVVMLAILMSVELVLVVAWLIHAPGNKESEDPIQRLLSGSGSNTSDQVLSSFLDPFTWSETVYKILWLTGYGSEAVALGATCLLQGCYQNAIDAAEDLADEEAEWRGREPLIRRSTHSERSHRSAR